jgi:YD repeat-containing protein
VNYEKSGNTLISIDGNGNRMTFVFDELDRLSQIIDAEGGITTHEYNGLNQLKKIIFPNGSDREFDYDKLQQPTKEKIVLEQSRPQFREIRLSA